MTKEELMQYCLRVFNFSEDEDFKSFEEILECARKNLKYTQYNSAASLCAEYLAKYIDNNHRSSFFVKYLAHHSAKFPNEVGTIYLTMLDSGIYPDYKKENILHIVNSIYKNKYPLVANKICNLYGAKGYDFLVDIYTKNRRSKK